MKRRKSVRALSAALLAGSALALCPIVHAAPGDEQGQVRRDIRAGNVRPLREIEQKVLPSMPGMQYLGPEYDPTAMAYRLKFIHNGRVVFVDVDARSGQIISRH
jgi:uncharacterized membrane protein YkoI